MKYSTEYNFWNPKSPKKKTMIEPVYNFNIVQDSFKECNRTHYANNIVKHFLIYWLKDEIWTMVDWKTSILDEKYDDNWIASIMDEE